MKLVGKAVKEMILRSDAGGLLEQRFYNAIAPQIAEYPLAIGKVTAIEPVDFKASPNSGLACTDVYYYRVTVFDFDIENVAVIAQKVRKAVDRRRPGQYGDMQINMPKFLTAAENAFRMADERDLFSWDLDFQIRVDFSTDDT
jgi:hypothetical protein